MVLQLGSSGSSSVILNLFLRSLLSNTLSAVSNSAAFACLSYTSGISSSNFNGGSHSPPISDKKSVLIGFPFSFSKLNFALSLITFALSSCSRSSVSWLGHDHFMSGYVLVNRELKNVL